MRIGRKHVDAGDWTTVHGWDATARQYVNLDCEGWIRENGIREAGRENGKRSFP